MKLKRLFRFVLLLAAGGMVFQTSTVSCCPNDFFNAFIAAATPALTSAIESSITSSLTGSST